MFALLGSLLRLLVSPAYLQDIALEIRALATEQTDDQIACTLNSCGYRSETEKSFTASRVRSVHFAYGIESYCRHLQRCGWLTLPEIARKIGVYPHTARTYAKGGILRAVRVNGKDLLFEPMTGSLPKAHPKKGASSSISRA